MFKDWKGIAAIPDSATRLFFITFQNEEILSHLVASLPHLFTEEERKPIPRSVIVKKEFELRRADPINKLDRDDWIWKGAQRDWCNAVDPLGIPTASFYHSGDDCGASLHMLPELEIQLCACDTSKERYGHIVKIQGCKMVVVGTDGTMDCVVLAPLECIDLNS